MKIMFYFNFCSINLFSIKSKIKSKTLAKQLVSLANLEFIFNFRLILEIVLRVHVKFNGNTSQNQMFIWNNRIYTYYPTFYQFKTYLNPLYKK